MQLVIPMAGLGARFSAAGYKYPKPFLPLLGRTLIEIVVENLDDPLVSKIVLIANSSHATYFDGLFKNQQDRLEIVWLDKLSGGPADSVLAAKSSLNQNLPLLIANSDQYVSNGLTNLYDYMAKNRSENALITITDNDPKWSFVRLDPNGFVLELKEKEVISNAATAGIYGFSSAGIFFDGLSQMYEAKDKTNGEYYVGPVYNYLSNKTRAINLGQIRERFFGLGIPEDYEYFKIKFGG